MMNLLVLKERMKELYQRFEYIIEPIMKFVLAMIVLSLINSVIGYDVRLKKLSVIIVLSLLSAFTPSAVMVLIVAVVAFIHVYFASKILSVITILIVLILYFLLLRFTPKQSFVVLMLPMLFILKIPYAAPILLGIISTPVSIIPVGCGVVVYFLFSVIQTATTMPNSMNAENALQLYKYVMDGLFFNKQMISTIIVFSIVIILTYSVRRLKIHHAFNMAIIVGAAVNILIFLIIDLQLDISGEILSMIIGTIISVGIVYIVQFFRLNLDYSRVENVQFEDDDYYYYVKAVPKINVTTPDVSVKRINPQKATEDIIGNRMD